jgi:hypothetical protein
MNIAIGVWAAIWVAIASFIAYRAQNRDRLSAAGWMIAIAAFLAVQEDPGLLIYVFFDRTGRRSRPRPGFGSCPYTRPYVRRRRVGNRRPDCVFG